MSMNFFKHLHTVGKHRRLVRKLCFKCGLIRQGLTHDLSKYSFAEFWSGVKYYQGYRSPQAKEREELGYSAAWLHHKGRNKHQVRMIKRAKEIPRGYTVDARACHIYHSSPEGKECWCIMGRITNQNIGHI